MSPGGERNLTDGEIALCRPVFGDAIPYDIVTLHDGPGLNIAARIAFRRGNPAITLGRRIYFKAPPPADISAADDGKKVLFIHEMTHVWQYRRLTMVGFFLRYADEFVSCGFDADKLYHVDWGKVRFADATLEAQAEIVSGYDRTCRQKTEPGPALSFSMAGSGLYGGL